MVKIAIIGAGTLGIKIAGEMAYHGHHVKIHDANKPCLDSVKSRMENDKLELKNDGILQSSGYVGSVLCIRSLEDTVNDADFIFECVIEDLHVKMDLMERITCSCRSDAVIGTNSLKLKVDDIFSKAEGRDRCMGLRFLFPVFAIPEVEVTTCQHTTQANVQKVRMMLEEMGKMMFFRSGSEPLILTVKQVQERKKAFLEKVLDTSEMYLWNLPPIAQNEVGHGGYGGIVSEGHQPKKGDECEICMERKKDCLLCPCHHLVACYQCAKTLLNRKYCCPVCRKGVTDIIKVHHS